MAVALAFFYTSSVADIKADEPLTIRPQWQVGDKVHYLLTKSRVKSTDGTITLNVTSKTDVWFDVLKADDEHYVVSVSFSETRFDDPKFNADPLVKGMSSLLKGLKIILTVSHEGLIGAVQNWQELQKVSSQVIERLDAYLKDQRVPATTTDKVIAQVRSLFASEDLVRQAATREIQLLFVPLGKTYVTSKPYEYETALPNLLGGEPIPSQGKFTLKALDRQKGQATINWTQSVNSKEFTRIMSSTMQSMARSMGKPMPDGKSIDSMAVNDAGEFVIDVHSGWSTTLTHTRKVGTAEVFQADTTLITKKQ